MKHDSERVWSWLQEHFSGNSPAAEHVVCVQNRMFVQIDIRKGIQAIKNHINVVMRERSRVHLKCCSILPVGQADPLQMELIILIEGIGNQAAAQQVGLHYARNLRGMPFFNVRSICVRHRTKLPPGIEVTRGSFGRLQGLSWHETTQKKRREARRGAQATK
jgi:hypothetical protein